MIRMWGVQLLTVLCKPVSIRLYGKFLAQSWQEMDCALEGQPSCETQTCVYINTFGVIHTLAHALLHIILFLSRFSLMYREQYIGYCS